MTKVARQEHEEGDIAYFYVVNPHRTHSGELVLGIWEHFASRLELVILAKRVEVLANTKDKEAGVDNNVALKILDWVQALLKSENKDAGQVRFGMRETIEWGKTSRQLCLVNNAWMTLWLKQRGFELAEYGTSSVHFSTFLERMLAFPRST
ncbi:hypothetical protein N7G274_004543 [Stereocaulon virgatum]|uniref:Uncharacterized protein n=1 Tax=Stereocaulon virgatum TaxID=373712 RepID=A0ABR4ADJ0_9LECA